RVCASSRPTRSTLFPYTTLFRSELSAVVGATPCAGPGSGLRTARRLLELGAVQLLVAPACGQQLRMRTPLDNPPVLDHQDQIRRSEEHTSELQSRENLVCRLLLE